MRKVICQAYQRLCLTKKRCKKLKRQRRFLSRKLSVFIFSLVFMFLNPFSIMGIEDFGIMKSRALDPNLALNSGFESGTANWSSWSSTGAAFSINNANARTGAAASSISASSSGYHIWYQEHTTGFDAGDTVYFSVYAKLNGVVSSSGGGVRISITGFNTSEETTSYCTSQAMVGTTDYIKLEAMTVLFTGTTKVRVSLEMVDATGTVYFDDAVLNNQTRIEGMQSVSSVEMENGMPVMKINGQIYAPVFFCANTDYTDTASLQNLFEEFEKATKAGIDLLSIVLTTPWARNNLVDMDKLIQQFININPNVKILIRVRVTAPYWYYSANPNEFIKYSDSSVDTQFASYASDKWKNESKESLTYFIRHIRSASYSQHVIGYYLSNHNTDEWFYSNLNKYADYSENNKLRFRTWLANKYGTTAALQSAWSNYSVTLSTAEIPTQTQRSTNNDGMFLNQPAAQNVIDYQTYHNEIVALTISEFAELIKEETDHKALVGTFYGYINELSSINASTMGTVNSGHLAMQKLLNDDNIDLIGGPYSYIERVYGGLAGWHSPVDSVMAKGKIYILEDDTRTHLTTHSGSDPTPKAANLDQSIELIRRNFMMAAARGAGIWYLDLFSDGNWNDQAMWNEIGKLKNHYQASIASRSVYSPDIAYIVSETAPLRMRADKSFFEDYSLNKWRFELQSTGANVGFYYIDQLASIPDSTKVYVFANCYDLTDSDIALINSKVKKNGNVAVFSYASGYLTDTSFSMSRMSSLVGMNILKSTTSQSLVTKITNSTHPYVSGAYNSTYGVTTSMKPVFYVSDSSATILGKYTAGSGLNALAVKNMGTWTSVYSGSPMVPASILRNILTSVGVSYTPTSAGTNIRISYSGSLLGVTAKSTLAAGNYTITLPKTYASIRDVSTGAVLATYTNAITLYLEPGRTKALRLIETAPSSANLLLNPSFESGTTYWNYHGSYPSSLSVLPTGRTGKSIRLQRSGSTINWFEIVYQTIPVSPGETYSIEAYAKTNISNPAGFASLVVAGFDQFGNVIDYIYANIGGVTSWTKYDTVYTPSVGVVSIYVQAVAKETWNNGDYADFDDFYVKII